MTESLSTPMQSPTIGVDLSPEAAIYVGVLEGTLAALAINEAKYRALLELLTGESWEATRIDIKGEMLQQLSVDILVKQTGMDRTRAKVLVAKRWGAFNEEAPAVIPKAVAVDQFVSQDTKPSTKRDAVATGLTTGRQVRLSDRFKDWKGRQLEAAEEL